MHPVHVVSRAAHPAEIPIKILMLFGGDPKREYDENPCNTFIYSHVTQEMLDTTSLGGIFMPWRSARGADPRPAWEKDHLFV